jgi:hypothetical protein
MEIVGADEGAETTNVINSQPTIGAYGSAETVSDGELSQSQGCLAALRQDDCPVVPQQEASIDRSDGGAKTANTVPETEDGPGLSAHFDDECLSIGKASQDQNTDIVLPAGLLANTAPVRLDDECISQASSPEVEDDNRAEKKHDLNETDNATAESGANGHKHTTALDEIARAFGPRPSNSDVRDTEEEQVGIFEMLNFERRRPYKVKLGDSLHSIATRVLRDPRLVPLLIRLNRELLTFDRNGRVKLQVGATIRLPSRAEALRYLAQLESESASLINYADGAGAEHIVYVCRLGDTLKTIAKRHPAIRDARMWPLIAKLNQLDTLPDERGEPVARVQRGQRLMLPRSDQCSEFLFYIKFGHYPVRPQKVLDSEAAVKTGFGAEAIDPLTWLGPQDAPSQDTVAVPISSQAVGNRAKVARSPRMTSRVVTQPDLGDGSDSLILRLEINIGGSWSTVIEYKINCASESLVTVYTNSGRQRSISIDLPDRAARELAENDLAANNKVYCDHFLCDRIPF